MVWCPSIADRPSFAYSDTWWSWFRRWRWDDTMRWEGCWPTKNEGLTNIQGVHFVPLPRKLSGMMMWWQSASKAPAPNESHGRGMALVGPLPVRHPFVAGHPWFMYGDVSSPSTCSLVRHSTDSNELEHLKGQFVHSITTNCSSAYRSSWVRLASRCHHRP